MTESEFQDAISHLTESGQLAVVGERQNLPRKFKVYDATPNPNPPEEHPNQQLLNDITPDEATLAQALIDFQLAKSSKELSDVRQSQSKTQFAAIPIYARMTEQQAIDYIDINVTDLASAKVVLAALARMVIALRNDRFPDLEGD